MKIQWMPIAKVKPYSRNPRINDNAVARVAESIREYGWQQPIVVDRKKVIIAGHTRYKAAQLLKHDQVPVQVAEGLTPQQVKAYRIADNRVAELSNWDYEALVKEIAQIDEDLQKKLGFDEDELKNLLSNASSLDELRAEYGVSREHELWPMIGMRVPPPTYELFQKVMGEMDGETEADKLQAMLERVA